MSTSVGYIRPSERLALCEIARRSLPACRCRSIHAHRSLGSSESSALNGTAGTRAQSLKKILRWRFMLLGMDVHSYEQKAVNLPGSLALLASSMLFVQIVCATSGLNSALT